MSEPTNVCWGKDRSIWSHGQSLKGKWFKKDDTFFKTNSVNSIANEPVEEAKQKATREPNVAWWTQVFNRHIQRMAEWNTMKPTQKQQAKDRNPEQQWKSAAQDEQMVVINPKEKVTRKFSGHWGNEAARSNRATAHGTLGEVNSYRDKVDVVGSSVATLSKRLSKKLKGTKYHS